MHRSHLRQGPASRRALIALLGALILVSVVAVPLCASAALPNPTFTFYGAGFGHGVGMSQYGARGYADHGYGATWMMGHYFPGTTLWLKPGPSRTVFVNVDRNAQSSQGAYTRTSWTMRAGWPGCGISINGGASLPDTSCVFKVSGTRVAVTYLSGKAVPGSPFAGSVTVSMTGTPPSGTPPLIQVVGSSGPFDYGSVRYRGIMDVASNGSKLKLLNELNIEAYLYGVVPRESPSSWPLEALKAQAIVARSYAYTDRAELYCDTRSQVYGGYSHKSSTGATVYHEASRSNSAVIATKALYVTYGGVPITTYFSASSGGYTARSQDAWTTSIPYLQGVPDPYGAGSYDPWTTPVSVTGLALASKLADTAGAPTDAKTNWSVTKLDVTHQWPTGFALSTAVTWTKSDGTTTKTTVSDGALRSRLGLKSTKYYVNAVGDRLGQSDRYLRAVAASQRTYPSGAKTVIIANADTSRYADMACAVALAGVAHGPVLYVSSASVPSAVSTEIKRLKATRVYVVGGTGAVSSTTLSKLKALVPTTVRLAGADRYATAVAVANKARALGADGTKAVIANGFVWADDLMAAELAGGSHRVLLFASSSSLPASTTGALSAFKSTSAIVVGNKTSLPDAVIANVTKLIGRVPGRFGLTGTSFDTAAAIATYGKAHMSFSVYNTYVGPTASITDAFLAGAMAAETRRTLLLAPNYTPPSAARTFLGTWHSSVSRVVVVAHPVSLGLSCGMQLMSDAY